MNKEQKKEYINTVINETCEGIDHDVSMGKLLRTTVKYFTDDLISDYPELTTSESKSITKQVYENYKEDLLEEQNDPDIPENYE